MLVALAVCALLVVAHEGLRAQAGSGRITDDEFWRVTSELSESGGRFAQQLMSNEDSLEFVVPALMRRAPHAAAYLGVGAEQNFTYLAALQPSIAFIVDIRRENMLELLMYKALFERAPDRAAFVSQLFSRPRPDGVGASTDVAALFDAFGGAAPDAALFDQTSRAIVTTLTETHHFALEPADRAAILGLLDTFRRMGPGALKGYGDRTNLTYAEMMAVSDLDGQPRGFLATESNYRAVRALEQRNLIIGVTGDFAGDRALPGIAAFLKKRHTNVGVFYVSNVERYLFEQGDHGRQFYRNVAALPLEPSSAFIRSVTRDISERLGIALPAPSTKWWTFLSPIRECLDGIASGRIQTYKDLFAAR